MATIDYVRDGHKTNSTPKAKKLKTQLESFGHTDVHVWWENLGMAVEMCGCSGGYMALSEQMRHEIEPLGYSFTEAENHIKTATWLHLA